MARWNLSAEPANTVVSIHVVVDDAGRYHYVLSIPPDVFEGPEGGCDGPYEAISHANMALLMHDHGDARVPEHESCPQCGQDRVGILKWTEEEFEFEAEDGTKSMVGGPHFKCLTCGYHYGV